MFYLSDPYKTPFIRSCEEIKSGILNGTLLTPAGNRYRKASAYNYKQTIAWLKKYQLTTGEIYVEDINIPWATAFITFLMDAGLAKNSISIIISRVKSSLRRLYDQGQCKFNGSGIRAGGELTTAVYNNMNEVTRLWQMDLVDEPGIRRVRDVYVLHCMVGLRFSDLKKLLINCKQYIKEEGGQRFFDIVTQKTGAQVVIPVASVVAEILEANNYDFGNIFSYQYYNSSLKKLGQRARFDSELVMTRTQGGIRQDKVMRKWMLMSSNTARRSFATNAFLAKVPIFNIMQITGHLTQTSFHRYIRCSSLEAALTVADHPFFTHWPGFIKEGAPINRLPNEVETIPVIPLYLSLNDRLKIVRMQIG